MAADDSIIDLCSSSEDEDDDVVGTMLVAPPSTAKKPPPNSSRRRSKPVTPEGLLFQQQQGLQQQQAGAGLDDKFTSSVEKPETKKPRQKALKFSYDSDDSSDSDDDLGLLLSLGVRRPTAAAAKKKQGARSSTSTKPSSSSSSSTAVSPSSPPASPTKKAKTTTSSASSNNSSNILIRNPYLASSSSTSAKATTTTATTTTASTSSTTSTLLTYPNPSGQTYADLRPQFILALWKHARTLVHASYNLGKLDSICKRINTLALTEFPIRSVDEYCQRTGPTLTTDVAAFKQILKQGGGGSRTITTLNNNSNSHGQRCYVSIAEACLVSFLEYLEESKSTSDVPVDQLQQKENWISLAALLKLTDNRLPTNSPGRLDLSPEHYLEPSTRSAEFKQFTKLESSPQLIKRHRWNKQVYYELTAVGYRTALTVRQRTFPLPAGHYRTSNLTLDNVPTKFVGIYLAVDQREGGGIKLHSMCNKLDTLKIPYFVRNLQIGDYCFFTSDNKLLPVLVERKSIQDVAASIDDKRWFQQKHRMYQGQFVFGFDSSKMVFVIEGNIQNQLVTGNYVADKRYGVTETELNEKINNLQSEGFEVLRTQTVDHSMVELTRFAFRLQQDIATGKLKASKYTYDEFIHKVQQIPKSTDFSRIAKDRAAEAAAAKAPPPKPTAAKENDFFTIHKKQSGTTATTKTTIKSKPTAQRKLVFGQAANKKKPITGGECYNGMSVAQLKQKCQEYGLPKTGTKAVLIERLNGPKPPKIWLQRRARNVGYVPSKHNTCATALLVGLWLEQQKHTAASNSDWKGMTKEELYALAESLDISKDPFSGVATTGPYRYDGWSSLSDLRSGEIPLVVLKKGRFLLTTSSDVSGFPLAEALHKWCHEHQICKCQQVGYEYNDDDDDDI